MKVFIPLFLASLAFAEPPVGAGYTGARPSHKNHLDSEHNDHYDHHASDHKVSQSQKYGPPSLRSRDDFDGHDYNTPNARSFSNARQSRFPPATVRVSFNQRFRSTAERKSDNARKQQEHPIPNTRSEIPREYGLPSSRSLSQEYGAPTIASSKTLSTAYNAPNARSSPSSVYGVPNGRSSPSSEYGVPNARSSPSTEYGVPNSRSSPSSEYDVPNARSSPSSEYSVPNARSLPSSEYGVPNAKSLASSEYGVPNSRSSPSSEYGVPNARSSPSSEYGVPNSRYSPSSEYGVPNARSSPSSEYGVPNARSSPSSEYGVPNARSSPSSEYGVLNARSLPSSEYNVPNARSSPSSEYGVPNARSSPSYEYGVPNARSSPSSEYGVPSESSSIHGTSKAQSSDSTTFSRSQPVDQTGYSETSVTSNKMSHGYEAPRSIFSFRNAPTSKYGAPSTRNSNTQGYDSVSQIRELSDYSTTNERNLSPDYEVPTSRANPKTEAVASSYPSTSSRSSPTPTYLPSAEIVLSQEYGAPDPESQGYENARARALNELLNQEPANYDFGYQIEDQESGTDFGHSETREENRAEGSYFVILPTGTKQTVEYEADEGGFKPRISVEATDAASARAGGYDDNAKDLARSAGGPY